MLDAHSPPCPPAPYCSAGAAALGSAEDARERGELQKGYYSFLHSLVHNDLAGALLRAPPGALDAALGALMQVRDRGLSGWGGAALWMWVVRAVLRTQMRLCGWWRIWLHPKLWAAWACVDMCFPPQDLPFAPLYGACTHVDTGVRLAQCQ